MQNMYIIYDTIYHTKIIIKYYNVFIKKKKKIAHYMIENNSLLKVILLKFLTLSAITACFAIEKQSIVTLSVNHDTAI